MAYWLVKSEPDSWSWDEQVKAGAKGTAWTGVRNFTAKANLEKMNSFTRKRGIRLRPHAKTHKCVEIARRQLAGGAAGICVATLAEAEVMAGGGIGGLLITGEVAGQPKISRLIQVLLRAPETMLVVMRAPVLARCRRSR